MKVYIYEGYAQAGGTYMAYALGEILHRRFGLPITIVGRSLPENAFFTYPYEFPVVTHGEFLSSVRKTDLLICNPSFHGHFFGLNVDCVKLTYIQHMNTYQVLDGFFDYYVSVSSFVSSFVSETYGLETPVINAYIDTEKFRVVKDWDERDGRILVFNRKPFTRKLFINLVNILQKKYGFESNNFVELFVEGVDVPGGEICESIYMPAEGSNSLMAYLFNQYRYFLSLSPLEGFGLPMLEAMACGCAVTGFDAMGGRDYLSNRNSITVQYPNLGALGEKVATQLFDRVVSEEMSRQAAVDGMKYSKDKFEAMWVKYFESEMKLPRGVAE